MHIRRIAEVIAPCHPVQRREQSLKDAIPASASPHSAKDSKKGMQDLMKANRFTVGRFAFEIVSPDDSTGIPMLCENHKTLWVVRSFNRRFLPSPSSPEQCVVVTSSVFA